MKERGRFTQCVAVMMVAVLIAGTGLSAVEPGVSRAAAPDLGNATYGRTMGWAQVEGQPPIEQVGEDVPGDPEDLDAGVPPAQTSDIATDQDFEDVETLDQGSPPPAVTAPATTTTTTASAPAAAPVTTTTVSPEPAYHTGPVLPPGFGSGRVHVSAGPRGFPVGLNSCHVGVVTGRAYVGLDCDEVDAEDVVGFAPSFDDFPFIPEVDFPFEGDEEFFLNPNFPFGDADDDAIDNGFFASGRSGRDDTRLVVSASQGARGATASELAERGVAVTGGNGSIELAQRTRDRDPRVRVRDRSAKSTTRATNSSKNTSKNSNGNSSKNKNRNSGNSARSASNVEMAQSTSRKGKKKRAKGKTKNKNRKKGKSQKSNAKRERKQKAKAERKQKAKAERKQKAKAERKQKAEVTNEQKD